MPFHQAHVVAAQVPMRQAAALCRAGIFSGYEDRKRSLKPALIDYLERQERRTIRSDDLPEGPKRRMRLRKWLQWRLSIVHRVDLSQHEFDFPLVPGWRPIGGREIFDDENWGDSVVFPSNQLGNEIATDQRVIANLAAKHLAD